MEDNAKNAGVFAGPDKLLEDVGRSIMTKAVVISILAHLILTGATSVSLFKDWATYGVHSPSYINGVKTQERKAAEEADRKKKAEEKAAAAAEAAKAAAEAAKAEKGKAAAQPAAPASAAQPEAAAQPAASGEKVPPEVQPLPPKKEFTLGDDLSLDD